MKTPSKEKAMTKKEALQLFSKFMNFTVTKRWEIALELGVVAEGESIESHEITSRFLVRAKKMGKLDQLKELMNKEKGYDWQPQLMERDEKPMTAKDLQDQFREETGLIRSKHPLTYSVWLEKKYLQDCG